ncbi:MULTISPECIES: signal peptidase II [Streptomyces]|uniref:Lipoprotein signal peptidase n=2 Tax=Streptomyces TaxID=1883 RepID=A0ABS9JBW5_9ACTN|nr:MULTISPECIES: signal peptidase II [Streptomyces]MCG0063058.1 signal peptidase II [Streptomyces tricolor]OYP18117.1 signal peptidase II [Streptomyces sp. FBKL.4005]BCM66281.1 putative lipoprotein signal peptidase [Streptomyces sp. EAS-AB2608]
MAEAERIIGTPDTPDDDGEQTATAGAPAGSGATGPSGEPGASGAGGQDGPARRAGRGRRIAVLFAVAAFAYALDLISKLLVVSRLEGHAPIQVVGDLLELHAIRNPGAAFGFGAAFTVIFTLIAAAVIVVIIRLARKLYSFPWAVALGLLLGGALGNLTDRIFRAPGVFEGEVVDFIAPKGFAVFNLADSAIVCGGILIVLLSFRGLDPDGTVHKD